MNAFITPFNSVQNGIYNPTHDTKLVQDVVLGVWAGFASTGLNETATKSITSIIDGFANGFGKPDKTE